MDLIIDVINTVFAFIGIYFTILFLDLFFTYKKRHFHLPEIKRIPSVSIIIPAYNEEETIGDTVKAVKNMIYPKKKEIIIVDDGSKDRTYEIAKKIKGIKVLTKKNGGKATALNFGLKHVKGEIVVCVD